MLNPNFSKVHGIDPSDHWESPPLLPVEAGPAANALNSMDGGGGGGTDKLSSDNSSLLKEEVGGIVTGEPGA